MDLFFIKKLIAMLIMPMSIITILLILAILFFKAKPKFSFKCLLSASLLLIISSLGFVADKLILPLENDFEPYSRIDSSIDYIVILGCGHTTDDALPVTAQLYTCSLQRLVEAIRISNIHPEAQIITSGAALGDEVANAEKVKQALVLLGMKEEKILVESFPKDTEEEAELIAPRVRGKNVILITNADHMSRSVNYFATQGVTVIPAPASYFTKGLGQEKEWSYYLTPNPNNLVQTTTAWYEYLGLTVQWLKTLFK